MRTAPIGMRRGTVMRLLNVEIPGRLSSGRRICFFSLMMGEEEKEMFFNSKQ